MSSINQEDLLGVKKSSKNKFYGFQHPTLCWVSSSRKFNLYQMKAA